MKTLFKIFISIGVICLIVYAVNYFTLQTKMNKVINDDQRNTGIEVSVHYRYYIYTSILIYDLKEVSGTNSRADVFRVFLQYSKEISSKSFKDVLLSYNGSERFSLDGVYFQTLGEEYTSQNPVYTMRTFCENVRTPEGNKAFSSWSGGWLGVMSKQMEDFNEFHNQWYGK